MSSLRGLVVPVNQAVDNPLWWAMRGPRLLAGMAMPEQAIDFADLHRRGLTQLVTLTDALAVDPAPLASHVVPLQDLFECDQPDDPDLEWQRVETAALTVRQLLDDGHGVLVHCLGGTGRTGTVVGAVVASFGGDLGKIEQWLDAVHRERGKNGWPESPWQTHALAAIC